MPRKLRKRSVLGREAAMQGALLIVSFLAGLAIWEVLVLWFDIPSYVLPAPRAVFAALADGVGQSPLSRASVWYHLADTLLATVIGFLLGSAIGLLMAAVMAEFRVVERLLFPYMAAFQSLPKVAIAPLYVIWFGYQIESKIAMAATLALLPVLLNTLQGLLSTERDRLDLMASLGATRLQVFWLIRLPASLPFIFAGLNLAIVYGLLGALVAEFIGAQRGMGVMIMQLQAVNDTAGVFAILLVLAVVGYALIALMRAVQHRIVFWSGDTRSSDVA